MSNIQNLDPIAFKAAIEQNPTAIIIDVRSPEEIAEGKIPNALEINFFDKNFKEQLNELDPDTSYFIYCQSGKRSYSTCSYLETMDFDFLHNLVGGMMAWQRKF